jgi:hypothetical protein
MNQVLNDLPEQVQREFGQFGFGGCPGVMSFEKNVEN